ncbi:hypothetical protein PCANC_27651 [Puccinia coronata f. sp. avenae]|uniref:PWWP domain-containing protein n=1 Tax=Puccinia coronata f. sp. avenae TaxID=200324 RepID=A0A2N5RVX8_9BASI|nr:hypothetical protein PCANC_27651 [Puccinia coronata f. sp. avenae]
MSSLRQVRNVAPLVSTIEVLNGTDVFPRWRARLEEVLSMQGTLDIVQGILVCPKLAPGAEPAPAVRWESDYARTYNPKDILADWEVLSELACSTIKSTLSTALHQAYRYFDSPHQLLSAIVNVYETKTRSHRIQLQKTFWTAHHDQNLPVSKWISRCRAAADSLGLVNQRPADQQIADRLVAGLARSWSDIQHAIVSSPLELSLDATIAALEAHQVTLNASEKINRTTYSLGDIVLVSSVNGRPAWPARVVNPDASPVHLRDAHKMAQKHFYLVRFFKTADYAWMENKEMKMLKQPEIRAFLTRRIHHNIDLKAAYQIALAPQGWEAELEATQMAINKEQQDSEIDELESVDDENDASVKPTENRKRPSENETPASPNKKCKSVAAQPVDATAPATSAPAPLMAAAPAVQNGGEKKAGPMIPLDGETVVREWRHRLQRLFLGKTALTEKMMPQIDHIFTDIEQYEMQIEWLNSSKLPKVLQRVVELEESKVPLDARYNIRARAHALQEKWRQQFELSGQFHHPQTFNDTKEPDRDDEKENAELASAKKSEEAAPKAMKSEKDMLLSWYRTVHRLGKPRQS